MRKTALFVSWCRPDLIRPRAVQVGRVAKGLFERGWKLHLICSTFDNEADLFDRELNQLYGQSFSSVMPLVDLSYYSLMARRNYDEQKALVGRSAEKETPWPEAVTARVMRWAKFRYRPLVISFAQPWETHLAVLEVKKRLPRLRWIAHFSDPWADSPYLGDQRPRVRDAALEQERAVIEAADAVVFVTESTADLTMQKYPAEWRSKTVAIPHMTDLELAETSTVTRSRSPRFRLTHTGTLYSGKRSGGEMFGTLCELRDAGVIRGNFELRLVGEMPPAIEQLIRDRGLLDVVSWTTPLYFHPSLAEMNAADALLVIDADFETSPFLPSKIFDYLMFDKPIVAVTPSGSATDTFLKNLGYETASPTDVEGIKRLISRLMDSWRSGTLLPTAAHIEARRTYDLHAVAERYVEQFARVRA
jgi:glycosyltransferase involved in cell wall biosynthesis